MIQEAMWKPTRVADCRTALERTHLGVHRDLANIYNAAGRGLCVLRDKTSELLNIRAADGQNAIEVVAYDGRNLLSSRGVKVNWKTDASAAAKPPRLFAVIAGVSDYDNPELNLRYPAKDAESMYQALRLGAEGLFGKGQVSLHH